MRLIYAGTPDFAVPALEALLAAGHEIVLVLTQPDRPAGRGMQPGISAVKQCAQKHGLKLHQPLSLKSDEDTRPMQDADAEALIVAAYGLILPPKVLTMTPVGAINIHASLLPRWRGAAPIHRAILAGDAETGVCIMRMDAGLDTGPVLSRRAVPISAEETGGSLHDKLAQLGAAMIAPALEAYAAGSLRPEPQSAQGVNYAAKIVKSETRIDWTQPADVIDRQVRALSPLPAASTRCKGADLKIRAAKPAAVSDDAAPGTVLTVEPEAVTVACGTGALALTGLQRAGGKALDAKEFLRGFPLSPGDRLGD